MSWAEICNRLGCTTVQGRYRANALGIIRPPEERSSDMFQVCLSMPPALMDPLDVWLLEQGISRSRYFQLLLERDLKLKKLV